MDENRPTVPEPLHPRSANAGGILARGAPLGRYLVLERLGAGGMGVVYAAYDPQLDRKVAVKLLRTEWSGDRDAARARLLREAQALARLAHPNVIAVHDVGTLGNQVFVAMEFVDGETLAEALENRPRDWRRALELYLQAGEGLAAAHQAGLVHRDFKPANALLGRDGRVRVLDFGLARAVGGGDEGAPAAGVAPASGSASPGLLATPLTVAGALLGTPAYMAPEQLAGQPADERSDQWSFAVALYEAVYGEHPCGGTTLPEMIERIRSGALRPEPPSTEVPRWLRAVLLRALSREPAARFAAMSDLLAALRADPLRARRRRLGIGFAVAAVLALAGGFLAWRHGVGELCAGAEGKLVGVWDPSRKTQVQAAFAASSLPFAEESWRAVAAALDRYAADWASQRTQACVATRVHGEQSEELLDLRMACLDQRLGELRALTQLLARADARTVERAVPAAYALSPLAGCADTVALKERTPLPRDPAQRARLDTARDGVAEIKAMRDAGKYREALAKSAPLLAQVEALGYKPLIAQASYLVGDLQQKTGDFDGGVRRLEDAVWAGVAGRDEAAAAEAAAQIVYVVGYRKADFDAASRWGERAAALLEAAGGDDAVAGELQNNLGIVYQEKGESAAAEKAFLAALELRRRAYGPDHPDVARALNNLGTAYTKTERYSEALDYFRRALAVKEKTLGSTHPQLATTLDNIGIILGYLGRNEEALGYHLRAVEITERALGKQNVTLAATLNNLGTVYEALGRFDDALAAERRALAINEQALGPDHPDLTYALDSLGTTLLRKGDAGAAEGVFRRSLAIADKSLGEASEQTSFPLLGLARALLEQRRPAEALSFARRGLAIRSRGPDKGFLAEARFVVARALWDSGQDRPAALALARQAREALRSGAGLHVDLLGEIEHWLAARGGALPPASS
ncbi:MAG: serine/threonine-protein kinase [Acidobacteriota bacterium]